MADDDEFRKQIKAMFKNVRSSKEAKYKAPLNGDNFHSYFATFRKNGHTTIRFFHLGKGTHGAGVARLFLEVANPVCNYLVIYKMDGLTGDITCYDPTQK